MHNDKKELNSQRARQSLIAAGIFGDRPASSYLVIWLSFALPFTLLAIFILRFLWVEPVLKDRVKEHFGWQRGILSLFTKLLIPTTRKTA